MSSIDFFNGDEFAYKVWSSKYALPGEETPEDMWRRLSREACKRDPVKTQDYYFKLFEDFKFVPAGRILAGLGSDKKVTYGNCYVIPILGDTLEMIFDAAKEIAITYSHGGGVGTDVSVLRWVGAPVHNSASVSTGSVSFMELYSFVTHLIGQKGRRGALLISMRDSHPDIELFIDSKSVPNSRTVQLLKQFKSILPELLDEEYKLVEKWLVNRQIEFANISVKVSDEFLETVKKEGKWELYFENDVVKTSRTVSARDLWMKIVSSAWKSGEPGILFWDKMTSYSNSEYFQPFSSVNPCGERPLPDYGVCLLGSVNLSKFTKQPFFERFNPSEPLDTYIDFEMLGQVVSGGVRFLDLLIDDEQNYPLEKQKQVQLEARRIGLGIMGLADLFVRLGVVYGSDDSLYVTETVMRFIRDMVYSTSIELAKEKGSFPAFVSKKYLQSPFVKELPKEFKNEIARSGIRNVELLSIAPTGSISVIAGASSGIEPIFSLQYDRYSYILDQLVKVYHPLLKERYKDEVPENSIEGDSRWITAHEIDPERRILVQAVCQRYVDASISSTVNLPVSATIEDVAKIYEFAYFQGLKGVTVYRSGSREDILRKRDSKVSRRIISTYKRPFEMNSKTYRFEYRGEKYYVAISSDESGLPREAFVISSEHSEWQQAAAFLLSKLLRKVQSESDVKEIVDDLRSFKEIHGRGVVYNDCYLPSRVGIIAQALELSCPGVKQEVEKTVSSQVVEIKGDFQLVPDNYKVQSCPSCSTLWLVPEGIDLFSCDKGCPKCGHSICS